MTADGVPFMTLTPGEDRVAIDEAIRRVVDRGRFVLGPELEAFEAEFAAACGTEHAIGVGNGTDAIALVLQALGIRPGDEVITTPLSAAYTALAVMMAGARPVFADIDPKRLTLNPDAVEAAVGPKTAAILPVHIYGQPADMVALAGVAGRHRLALVEDCCQAHFATAAGRPVGTFGAAGAFSFYPTKNLGALGDAGAVVTSDGPLAEKLKRLRNGGQLDRYVHVEAGRNSRLDEIQAAILRARLPLLAAWTERRRALAAVYRRELAGAPVSVPPECDRGHVYHLFPVRARERERLQPHLSACGIETLIHYPIPIPRQPLLAGASTDECPVADSVCAEVLSLPLHHKVSERDVLKVTAAIRSFGRT